MRQAARTFQDLIVWQKAHQQEEVRTQNSEVRRINSGFWLLAPDFCFDKGRFMNIAQGSLEECRYYLILAKDLNYGDTSNSMNQLEEVSKLLTSYANSILNSDS
ncbi:MAG: four helix bundle protein [Nostoc sp. LLA-1]|nr:four helix bundle protein [Cyanocohniella sp. LLY]